MYALSLFELWKNIAHTEAVSLHPGIHGSQRNVSTSSYNCCQNVGSENYVLGDYGWLWGYYYGRVEVLLV